MVFQFVEGIYQDISSSTEGLFEPGLGFWIKSRQNSLIDFGDGKTIQTNIPYQIHLRDGWHIISNPLYLPIPPGGVTYSNSESFDGSIWIWDGTKYNDFSVATDSLHAGQGALIYTSDDNTWVGLSINEADTVEESFRSMDDVFPTIIHIWHRRASNLCSATCTRKHQSLHASI